MGIRTPKASLLPLIRKLAAALIVAVMALTSLPWLSNPAPAAPKAVFAPQIEGTYSVQGTNPSGAAYQGRATITVKDNTAYIRWEIAGDTFHGQGPVKGNQLVVDWGEADPVIYQINPDGSLFGTWAKGRATDNLRPIK
ncbi:hypothetical protein K1718_26620 [Roseibium porphyridii]|uniref:Fibronectin-binding protein n=1 Tax=Roseibium porphyridii TaxID=2866279 RepID=A0ABY8F2R9_9HYPH|nr:MULTISPECIES: hypothetical protein [Stappiaceae]QFT34723.1 hypothetical protein FIV00_29780 [Labrenzia sp. THAF82]WFE89686.1 hypothetical protein K1718_26620 [Roseibium sp. KMA01]